MNQIKKCFNIPSVHYITNGTLVNNNNNIASFSSGQKRTTSNRSKGKLVGIPVRTQVAQLIGFQGCIKFPAIWYSSPTPLFKTLIFFPKMSVPFPSSPLDNLSYSLDIIEQIKLLPLTLFSTWYSSKKPLNFLPLFTTWNSSRKELINFPRGGEVRNFIHNPVGFWSPISGN